MGAQALADRLPEPEEVSHGDVQRLIAAQPDWPRPGAAGREDLQRDRVTLEQFCRLGEALLRRLPPRSRRSEAEQRQAELVHAVLRRARTGFLATYAGMVYADVTDDCRTPLRVEELVYRAAERYPGLVPSRQAVEAEGRLPQREKEGLEVDQGLFLSAILADRRAGAHLALSMLRPKPESLERLEEFRRTARVDLGTAVVERRGPVGVLHLRNTRYLNAEDHATLQAMETGVDLILLDPDVQVGVLRGAPVDHPRYAGRRIFNAGLNLTHLYEGKIPYLFFIAREMGLLNKMYRGLAGDEPWAFGLEGTVEKPWIAAVEGFAIGGGCQLLLVMDYVIAESGSYFNVPAKNEGFVPGLANLRLPRFVGRSLARHAVLLGRDFPADSPEGRMLCDRVVPPGAMDEAIAAVAGELTGAGLVSLGANRKLLRCGEEPLEQFLAYLALYAREQAYCTFSPALIRNLEQKWLARRRREGRA